MLELSSKQVEGCAMFATMRETLIKENYERINKTEEKIILNSLLTRPYNRFLT